MAWISQVNSQWLLEAKTKSYKLYDKSFLSLIYNTGWDSDGILLSAYKYIYLVICIANYIRAYIRNCGIGV